MLVYHNEQHTYDYENWEICSLTENSCADETRFYEVSLNGQTRWNGSTTLEVWQFTTKAEAEACYKEINLKSVFLNGSLEFMQNVTLYKTITFFNLKKGEEEMLVQAEFGDEWKMLDCYLVEDDGKTKTLFFETVGEEEKMYVYDGVYADENWSLEEQYKLATEDDCLALSGGVNTTPEQKEALLAALNIIDHEKFRRQGC